MARLRYALLALGVCLVAFLVHEVGVGVIVRNVRALGWWFLAIIGVWLAAYTLNTGTFSLILGPDRQKVGRRRLFGTVIAGFAMNYATPFIHMGGEPFRIAVLRQRVGGSRAAFATISFKALNALSSLCYWTIGAVVIALSGRVPRGLSALLIAVPAVALLVAGGFVRRHAGQVFVSLRKLTGRWRALGFLNRLLARNERALAEVDEDLYELWRTRTRALLGGLALETTARLVLSQEVRIVLYAMDKPVGLLTGVAIDSVANLMITAMFFIPFEVGAREGGLYLILSGFGMPAAVGVLVALVNRIRELFWIGVGFTIGHFLTGGPIQPAPAME